jgi:hypothetical protein
LIPLTVTGYRKKLQNGTQGAHQVHDQDEEDWVIKPTLRPRTQVKGTVNEYIAGSLARLIGLNVPEHAVLALPAQVIQHYPDLSNFTEGYVLGVRFENGLDLSTARDLNLISTILSGLTGLGGSNYLTAVGIIAADTWMWNADRSIGSWVPGQNFASTSNSGNLYFKKLQGPSGLWDLMAIDFGHAFRNCTWGKNTLPDWENVILGTMRFFFESGLLSKQYSAHQGDFEDWAKKIQELNLKDEVSAIIRSMPPEWLLGYYGAPIDQGDVDDLCDRLEKRQRLLHSIFVNHYSLATARY